MDRPVRKYVEKLEALDLSAGTYHARRLPPRARYNRRDFYEYLNELELSELEALEAMEDEDFFLAPQYEEGVG